jgi:hypothetical protein
VGDGLQFIHGVPNVHGSREIMEVGVWTARKQQKNPKKIAFNRIFVYVELMHMATRDISEI